MTSSLDGQYTVFGQLIRGYEALHQIGDVECVRNPGNPNEMSRPAKEVFLRKAYLSDAMGNQLAPGGSK
jgi:cyclophilin family peptidyl-prolyl cis-trans isomerase